MHVVSKFMLLYMALRDMLLSSNLSTDRRLT